MFSRVAAEMPGAKNALYEARDALVRNGVDIVDLIQGNVNTHGIVYPGDVLSEILLGAAAQATVYRPDSFGQLAAREAIAAYYSALSVTPDQVLITPGTSVSYWYCFKLLANAGDEILCPSPSYPLFDYIGRLCDVQLTTYPLTEGERWSLDTEALERRITPRTRAIVLISPHNPTGMVAAQDEVQRLAAVAGRHGLALIADEVFSEFLGTAEPFVHAATFDAPLVFTLNGFSKMYALPGMKIGWILVTGEIERRRQAMRALELISDTFLPVNEVAQWSVPGIFDRGASFLKTYREWIRQRRKQALDALTGIRFAEPEGGFYITLPIPSDEDEAAIRLLREDRVLVHPGYFYDMEPNHLVMTFIGDPELLPHTFARVGRVAR